MRSGVWSAARSKRQSKDLHLGTPAQPRYSGPEFHRIDSKKHSPFSTEGAGAFRPLNANASSRGPLRPGLAIIQIHLLRVSNSKETTAPCPILATLFCPNMRNHRNQNNPPSAFIRKITTL